MMVTSESLRTLGNEDRIKHELVGHEEEKYFSRVLCYGPVGKEDPPS